jgi:hypothetical protein
MTSPTNPARLALFCTGILVAVVACGSSAPRPLKQKQQTHQQRQQAEIAITGEFLPDGTCRVLANNVPVYTGNEHPVTTYVRGRAMNMAPAGYEVHELWCSLADGEEPSIPSEPDARAFFITVYAPAGKLATVQHYTVKQSVPSSRDASDVATRANVALFDPRYTRTGGDGAPPVMGVYLAGVRGEVILTDVKPDRVTGTFHALTVRERSMM